MSNKKLQLFARDIIEQKLGFKVSSNDIVLLESAEADGKVEYLYFYRKGFPKIEYSFRWVGNGVSQLEIQNIVNDTEMYIEN